MPVGGGHDHQLADYRQTLDHLREVGFTTYARRQFQPYVRAAVSQFSPSRRTLTERLLERFVSRG